VYVGNADWGMTGWWNQGPRYDHSTIYGVRAGAQVGRWIGLEATYARASARHNLGTPAGEADVSYAGLNVVMNLASMHRVSVYALGGAAKLRFDPDFTRRGTVLVEEGRQTLTGYAAGAGIRVAMVERLAMRFEILDVVAGRTLQTTDRRDRTHNLLLTAGLHFTLFATPDAGGGAEATPP